jgi:hypothetical protein
MSFLFVNITNMGGVMKKKKKNRREQNVSELEGEWF